MDTRHKYRTEKLGKVHFKFHNVKVMNDAVSYTDKTNNHILYNFSLTKSMHKIQ